jgi:hypothetical protein
MKAKQSGVDARNIVLQYMYSLWNKDYDFIWKYDVLEIRRNITNDM